MTEHVGVFHVISQMLKRNIINSPFEVIHVDAHADLGLRDSAWYYIFSKLLINNVENRLKIVIENLSQDSKGAVSSGNFCYT